MGTCSQSKGVNVIMQTMSINHLMQWCNKQNMGFDVFNAMLDKANEDLDYWINQDYWKLYDAIRDEVTA